MGLSKWLKGQRIFILKRRYLTAGEKKLAQSIFGSQLDLKKIQIVAHRFVLKHMAISPNGHVYFNEIDWVEDFSVTNIAKQSWLIHELTHVWQIQQGMAVVRRAIFDRRYAYLLETGKNFLEYGIEQQAQMVQDYFIQKQLGNECKDYENCIPFVSPNEKI